MTKQERKVLEQILKSLKNPTVRGSTYDGNFNLLNEGDDPKLLDNTFYKKGWESCYTKLKMYLEFLRDGTAKDFRKFAGRPESNPPGGEE